MLTDLRCTTMSELNKLSFATPRLRPLASRECDENETKRNKRARTCVSYSRHLFSGSGAGVLTKWYLPPDGQADAPGRGFRFGAAPPADNTGWVWRGARSLRALPSRSPMVGVCYDEGADTISAVSKHGHVVVAQGVPGLRL